jgi:hypothetical protein
MKFILNVIDGDEHRTRVFESAAAAHEALHIAAQLLDLDVHQHEGSWAGTAVSTAYERGGDPLLHAVAVVRPVLRLVVDDRHPLRCETCGCDLHDGQCPEGCAQPKEESDGPPD